MTERGSDASIGKHLFGRPARLILGTYFARRTESSYLGEISDALRLPQSAVAQELAKLVDLGMLDRIEVAGSRRVYYSRTDSPWWKVFEIAAEIDSDTVPGEAKPRRGSP